MKDYIRLNLGVTCVYLIPCKSGYLLIDTGYKRDYRKFRKLLARKKIDISEIKHLLLTHYHDDHAGFAEKLKREYDIPLIVQKQSIPLLTRGDNGDTGHYITKRLKALFSLFELFHRDYRFPPVIVDGKDIVVDGDDNKILRGLGLAADILFTSGHTEDSMSVFFDDGTAFVGDAAMNILKITGTRYRPILYTNEASMYTSIQRLITSGAKTILPAHGNPYPAKKLEKMLKAVRKR